MRGLYITLITRNLIIDFSHMRQLEALIFLHLLFFFVFASKFHQISQNSAKSCVVLVQKVQLFVLENHDICKNELRYKYISYERAHEKADEQFYEE